MRKWDDNPDNKVSVGTSLKVLNEAFLKSQSGTYWNRVAFSESTVVHFEGEENSYSGYHAYITANGLRSLVTGESDAFDVDFVEKINHAANEHIEDENLRKKAYNVLFENMFLEAV